MTDRISDQTKYYKEKFKYLLETISKGFFGIFVVSSINENVPKNSKY